MFASPLIPLSSFKRLSGPTLINKQKGTNQINSVILYSVVDREKEEMQRIHGRVTSALDRLDLIFFHYWKLPSAAVILWTNRLTSTCFETAALHFCSLRDCIAFWKGKCLWLWIKLPSVYFRAGRKPHTAGWFYPIAWNLGTLNKWYRVWDTSVSWPSNGWLGKVTDMFRFEVYILLSEGI